MTHSCEETDVYIDKQTRLAALETYQSPVNVKTPCLARPVAWFTQHRDAIMVAATDMVLADESVLTSCLPMSRVAGTILYDRVVRSYCKAVETNVQVVVLAQGCCRTNKKCHFLIWQRAILVALRTRIKEEEQQWPRDL